jgi:hypothetical protein
LKQINVTIIPDPDRIIVWLPTENFSVTGIDIWLTRTTTPFLLQFYLPSAMFVLISWISFVVPHDSGERTGMIVTLLLVVVSMYLAVVASSPKGKQKSRSSFIQYHQTTVCARNCGLQNIKPIIVSLLTLFVQTT